MDPIEKRVIELITGVLAPKNGGVVVEASSTMGDPLEWDSLAFVEIFLTITSHYELEVSDDDAISFMSVPEIVEFVSERT